MTARRNPWMRRINRVIMWLANPVLATVLAVNALAGHWLVTILGVVAWIAIEIRFRVWEP